MRNLYKKEIKVSSFDNLVVSLFVIGYKNIGESIVVLFRDIHDDADITVLSMVIDSYEKGSLNLTRRILEKHNVSNLDIVCWTHPHCDHSSGIDSLISDKFNDNIVIFSPRFYYGNLMPDLLESESKKTPQIFQNIWNLVEKHPNCSRIWQRILANGDGENRYPIQLYAEDGLSQKDVILHFLTPLGYRIDKYAIEGNQFGRPNELSVSFVMSIDGYDFYFGGDTEQEHASGIDEEIVRGMRWIKAPHHCSNGTEPIVNNLGPQLDYVASTVYKSSGLPKTEIQNKYAKIGTLHMTQLEETDDYKLLYEYGVIQYDYHFGSETTKVKITTYGNAGLYTPMINRVPDDDI